MRLAAEKIGGVFADDMVGILETEAEISERIVIAWAV